MEVRRPRFRFGKLIATPGAVEAMQVARQDPMDFLQRHVYGDWGDVDEEDREANERALVNGERIRSAYLTRQGTWLFVTTLEDRSATYFFTAEE